MQEKMLITLSVLEHRSIAGVQETPFERGVALSDSRRGKGCPRA